jgi:hypothetical protein
MTDVELEKCKSEVIALNLECSESRKVFDQKIAAWHRLYHAVEEELRRRKMREEIMAELAPKPPVSP